MPETPLVVTLKVSPAGRKVPAALTFLNQSRTAVFLYKVNACELGALENDLFRITLGDKKIEYTGTLSKLREPGPDDFIKLAPGATHETTVPLEKFYNFPAGPGLYRARFTAFNPEPSGDNLLKLTSNEVTFPLGP